MFSFFSVVLVLIVVLVVVRANSVCVGVHGACAYQLAL